MAVFSLMCKVSKAPWMVTIILVAKVSASLTSHLYFLVFGFDEPPSAKKGKAKVLTILLFL